MNTEYASAVIFLATLVLILVRPRGLNEALGAGSGAIACLLFRLVSFSDIRAIAQQTANVLVFLLGMMIVTGIAEHAGVFEALAERAARASRGSGHLLLLTVFGLGAAITALLSLDVTIIVLTPIVYSVVTRIGIDPLPYLLACAFVANTASLFLPMSNLTNLLVFDLLHLSFVHFAVVMFLPNIAALFVNIAVFFVLFRHRIPRVYSLPDFGASPRPASFRGAAVGLGATLIALFVFGILGWPLAIPAIVGALILGFTALTRREISVGRMNEGIAWPLFPFVFAMFIVIRAVEHAWIGHIGHIPANAHFTTLASVAFGTGLGANIVNNIPMAVAMISLLRATPGLISEPIAFATLIGTNIGPSIITVGSLATMLWLAIVRQRGVQMNALTYTKIGVITTPLMVAAATAALWFEIRFLHL